jgi:hypothetical protein
MTCVFSAPQTTPQDSLKSTHALLISSANSANFAVLGSVVHPRALGFFQDSVLPVVLTPDVMQTVLTSLSIDLASLVSVPYETEYAVMGDTGVVCVRYVQQKDGKASKEQAWRRGTFIYSKLEGKWLLVSWHISAMPLRPK